MIVRLPKDLIDQIAAGEVVVRPASVVKELVENSIDAQARHIYISVDNALRDIAVGDDGSGMARADARLALERHATSKIRSLEDLQAIRTRGFRGEALPSIAAVSRLTLTTRRPEDLAATCIVVEGGQVKEEKPIGAPPGTKVVVRDLFFNTPARLKFLKSPATELGQLTRAVVRQALASPSVAFRLVNRGRAFLDLPADQSLRSRVQQVLGLDPKDMIAVDFEKYGVRVEGFVAKPIEARRDRRHQFFFVNGRPVADRTMAFAVEQAYEGLVPSQRYPVVVLLVEIAPDEVDVNVHPSKEEVRFRDQKKVVGLLNRAVAEALRAADLLPEMRLAESRPPGRGSSRDRTQFEKKFEQAGRSLLVPGPPYKEAPAAVGRVETTAPSARGQERPAPADETVAGGDRSKEPPEPSASSELVAPPDQPPLDQIAHPRALGQVADTYIVAQVGEDLLVIDQHAAHERLLYLKACERERSATQSLLVPIAVEVRPSDRPLMEQLIPVLERLGFETESFGGQSFVVRSIPAMFEQIDVPTLINDLLDELAREGPVGEFEKLRERVLTSLACHAAIKAGQRLGVEEMQQLIDDLMAARLSYTCPHGRPTMILITRDQLDRQFKRK